MAFFPTLLLLQVLLRKEIYYLMEQLGTIRSTVRNWFWNISKSQGRWILQAFPLAKQLSKTQ